MIRLVSVVLLAFGATAVALTPTFGQMPTKAQREALRADCVSDFKAHCAGVPTGGKPALECLIKNVDSLSPTCKAAVVAVDPAAAN
jgi:Cysteine rich repeat